MSLRDALHTNEGLRLIAAAIANARRMRGGLPGISGVLDVLPYDIRREVMDDAVQVVIELRQLDGAA